MSPVHERAGGRGSPADGAQAVTTPPPRTARKSMARSPSEDQVSKWRHCAAIMIMAQVIMLCASSHLLFKQVGSMHAPRSHARTRAATSQLPSRFQTPNASYLTLSPNPPSLRQATSGPSTLQPGSRGKATTASGSPSSSRPMTTEDRPTPRSAVTPALSPLPQTEAAVDPSASTAVPPPAKTTVPRRLSSLGRPAPAMPPEQGVHENHELAEWVSLASSNPHGG